MNPRSNLVRTLLLTGILSALVGGVACAERHSYRVYDPYYTDYHTWNHDEDVYYHRWADETHHDANRDFRKLPPDQQKQYWTWRHNHGDQDRNRDRH
jgi:hypothetical protein